MIPVIGTQSSMHRRCYACGITKPQTGYTVHTNFTTSNMRDQQYVICDACASIGKVYSIYHGFKPFAAFPKGTNRGNTATFCKPCKNEYNKKCYDPEKQRVRMLKSHYNLTDKEYKELYLLQQGVCAICGQAETAMDRTGNRVRRLATDHNHTTGKVRGLLCGECNQLVGRLEQDKERIKRMLEYIENDGF
jgi:Recombination endonuclease VII